MSKLSHLDDSGRARMVDVSDKPATARTAVAEGRFVCAPQTLAMVRDNTAPKGAVLSTAELAGVMAAKRAADLIPLCHPLPLSKIEVVCTLEDNAIHVRAEARATGPTGVEMEALTAVSVACLTLFDMLKAVDKTLRIDGVRVLHKSGGRSGDFTASDQGPMS